MIHLLALALLMTTGDNLGLTDDAFWTTDWASWEAPSSPEPVVLAAPAHVELGRHATIPVVVRVSGRMREPFTHVPPGVIAVEPGGGRAWTGWSWKQKGDRPAPTLPPDDELQQLFDGKATTAHAFDLREQLLGFPAGPRRLRVWAVCLDRHSAPRELELVGGSPDAAPAGSPPAEAPRSAAGREPLELGPDGLRITPRKPGIVHVVVVGRDDGFPQLTSYRAAGPFTAPRPAGEAWVYVVSDDQLAGPLHVPARTSSGTQR